MAVIVEIRTAVPGDARAIASVLAKALAEYESLYTTEAFAATTPAEATIRERFSEGKTWIALSEEKIAGTVSVVPENGFLYVRSMAVLPVARGHRIGERLLAEIENYAVAGGFEHLTLSTTPFLNRAIRLYEKFGFVVNGSLDLYGTPLIKMVKNLGTVEDQ